MSQIPNEWDPTAHDAVADRFGQLADMRSGCPVAGTDLRGGMWTVTTYADLVAVASDPATFSSGLAPRFGRKLPPLEVDPPEHTVFRKVLQRFWYPSRVKAMEPEIRASAIALIDGLVADRGGDLARGLAYPLPVMALCTLLDIDRAHWADIKRWAEDSLGAESRDPDERAAAAEAHQHLLAHARTMIEDRKQRPRDPEADIPTALLEISVDGEPIDDELAAGVIRILISAGHNSTTNAIGNALLYLAEHRDAQQWLRDDPSRIPTAIEELLRYESPVQELPRWAAKDVELHGRALKAGDRIGMLWGSGNRDETVFEAADSCLLERKPNRHLAFGYGIHTCLGAPMARLELRIVLEEILVRTASFAVDGPVMRKPYHHMGVYHLPAVIAAAGDE